MLWTRIVISLLLLLAAPLAAQKMDYQNALRNYPTVSTTAPLAGGGALSSALTLSLPKADASHDGYLAQGDWTAFSAKQGALPLSAKGDLLGFGSSLARLPVGADGLCLIADSSQTLVLRYGACASGIPNPSVAQANATAQQSDIGLTALYAVPTGSPGMYRVSCYTVITRAASTSSTLPQCGVVWTDLDTSVNAGFYITSSSAANSVGTPGTAAGYYGVTTINAAASTNIVYLTNGYASSGATAMQFAIHLKLEYLGN